MRTFLSAIVRSLTRALFPPKCYACSAFLENRHSISTYGDAAHSRRILSPEDIFRTHLAPFLCTQCQQALLPVASPICTCCGMVFAGRQGGDHWCGACLAHRKKYTRARSAGVYTGPLKMLIHRLKYQGRTELAGPLGAVLYDTFIQHWKNGEIDCILPVPLHPRKERRRGFNQAFLMVAGWPGLSGDGAERAPVGIDDIALQRVRYTVSQTGLKREERNRNIRGAFYLRRRAPIRDRSILLIDDVYTTGATVTECTRVLLTGGARRVDVLTLARAV